MYEINWDDVTTTTEYGDELKRQLASLEDNVALRIEKAQADQKRAYDEKTDKVPEYKKGELIWLRNSQVKKGTSRKLAVTYVGPYVVTEVVNPLNVKVRKLEGGSSKRVHVNRIRKCYFWPVARPEDETQRSEESELQGRDPVKNVDESLLQLVIPENAFIPRVPI